MATFVPPPWVLASMMFLLMTIRLYTWYINDWEHLSYGFRHVSPSRPIHTRRRPLSCGSGLVSLPRTINTSIDFVMILKRTHTPLRSIGNLLLPDASLPGRPQITYRDLGFLHSRCDQLSLALTESCWGGRSPVIASPRVSPPPDALCHPRPDSLSLKIVIVQETPPTILLLKSLFKQRKVTPCKWELPSRGSPSP